MRNRKLLILGIGLLISAFLMTSCGKKNDMKNADLKTTKTESNLTASQTGQVTNSDGVKPIHLTAATFKEKVFDYAKNKVWKYEGSKPCIVDFYADWCKPCKMVAPILEELSSEYDGKLIVYKVNTDQEQELSGAFQIQSIPSLLFIPAKGQPQMISGAIPKEQFVKYINDYLIKD